MFKLKQVYSIILFSLIFSRENDKTHTNKYHNIVPHSKTSSSLKFKHEQLNRSDLNTIIFQEDFENNAVGWLTGSGWELTQDSYKSSTHSMFSPNNNANKDGYHVLSSPKISLPQVGLNEWIYFTFWIHADIPDHDGDNDGYLDDYYQLDVRAEKPVWHISNYEPYSGSGSSFWCGIEEDKGYYDGWLQFLDTPAISIPSIGYKLKAQMKWAIEDTEGALEAEVSEGWVDGWDAANVRISIDDGATWEILVGNDPYDFYSGYGWVYNGEGEGIDGTHSLASGWSGYEDWHEVEFDLSNYANKNVVIRFAFGADPAYSTTDDGEGFPVPSLKGLFVDEIVVANSSGPIKSYNADDGNNESLVFSGYEWKDLFYDSASEFCIDNTGLILSQYPIKVLCENDGYIWYSRPGSLGWEEYIPGYPECDNCNYLLDLTDYSGKDIIIRFWSRYDGNDDIEGGMGLFIDDLTFYKDAIKIYPLPQLFSAIAGASEVQLSWFDMSQAGDSTFIFDNGDESLFTGLTLSDCTECTAFAGTLMPSWLGHAEVHSISIYNINESAVDVTINAYSLIDNNPIQTQTVNLLEAGWNTFDVSWNFSSDFLIAHSFSDEIAAALDPSTSMAGLWFLSEDVGSWQYSSVDDVNIAGNWGIRASISFSGIADVTYSLYRDEVLLASGLTGSTYTDNSVENNITYEYIIAAVFETDSMATLSDVVSVMPLPSTIYELSHDDETFESEFNAGRNNFSAVRFSPGSASAELFMFKWYQIGEGGNFYIKFFEDNGSMPGDEIYSILQVAGNKSGWNQKDMSDEHINLSNNFWIGAKEFSSSKAFGLDTTDYTEGHSYKREGSSGDWKPVQGNLGFRVYLSSEPLSADNDVVPYSFGINEIFPNPFNPNVNIEYEINESSPVTISIYDLNGRVINKLVDAYKHPGHYSAIWEGVDQRGKLVSSGIYFSVLTSGNNMLKTRKLILLK